MRNPAFNAQTLVALVLTGSSLITGCSLISLTKTPIDCWGDSLTRGNQDGSGVRYPSVLAHLSYLDVYNAGVGGQTSTQIAAREESSPDKFGDIAVIWAGENNNGDRSQVESDIAAMVATLMPPKKFLVLSILNSDYPEQWKGEPAYLAILQLNADLAATYKENYFDIRSWLVSQYDPNSAADVADFAHDVPPASLRFDHLHLNARGYTGVAGQVYQKLLSLGYLSCSSSDPTTLPPNSNGC